MNKQKLIQIKAWISKVNDDVKKAKERFVEIERTLAWIENELKESDKK